jgi:membrane protein implicated in regulation of membrane protease activity
VVIAWIVAGVVLLAVELHHFALYALFVAVGCFAAAIVAVIGPGAIAAQVAVAVLVTAAGILVVRPRVSQTLERHGGHRGRGTHGGLVGHEVVTLDLVGGPGRAGHVMLAGERWLAASGADVDLPAGTTVLITGVEGTTLIVWPADGVLPVDGIAAADNGPLADEGER